MIPALIVAVALYLVVYQNMPGWMALTWPIWGPAVVLFIILASGATLAGSMEYRR